MGRDHKPIVYVVLLGLDAFEHEVQRAILNNFSDRLYNSLRTEGELPWVREHIKQCIVLSVDAWNQKFPEYRVNRVEHQEAITK
jgi:hypothetical protein